jgi:anthranilate phosphoribosyltransferase
MPLPLSIDRIRAGKNLSADETQAAFDAIFAGNVPAADIGAFLLGLKEKGETVDELRGAVASMRSKAVTIEAPHGAIDIVGTGGDAHGTLNISTATAFVVASCGVPVAKHGNRSASSQSGSSDVLTALGVHLEPSLDVIERCLHENNLCFLFAPRHHPAMRHVAAVRKELGVRTIFNLLGPLTNPANVTHHLIGVYDLEWLGPMAEVLKLLGSERAWLTHGHDGMDEITTTTATDVVELNNGQIKHFTLETAPLGIPTATLADLKGGDAAHNAAAMIDLLKGHKGAYRDIVVFNAAAALVIAGQSPDLRVGIHNAESAIDNGAALSTLNNMIRLTSDKAA